MFAFRQVVMVALSGFFLFIIISSINSSLATGTETTTYTTLTATNITTNNTPSTTTPPTNNTPTTTPTNNTPTTTPTPPPSTINTSIPLLFRIHEQVLHNLSQFQVDKGVDRFAQSLMPRSLLQKLFEGPIFITPRDRKAFLSFFTQMENNPLRNTQRGKIIFYFPFVRSCGFGCSINNALNIALLAFVVGTNYNFLVGSDYAYVSLEMFFEDSDNIILENVEVYKAENSDRESERVACPNEEYGKCYSKVPRTFEEFRKLEFTRSNCSETNASSIVMCINRDYWGWHDLYALVKDMNRTLGRTMYYFKTLFARSFWKLNNKTATILTAFLDTCDELQDRYLISIHLRRGDKSSESADVRTEVYVKKVEELVKSDTLEKFAVFVMSDDDTSKQELVGNIKALGCFVFDMSFVYHHLLGQLQSNQNLTSKYPLLDNDSREFLQDIIKVKHSGFESSRFFNSNPKFRLIETRGMILEITLASLAQQFIGTFTSNFGRLIAMLRSSYPLETNWDLAFHGWDPL